AIIPEPETPEFEDMVAFIKQNYIDAGIPFGVTYEAGSTFERRIQALTKRFGVNIRLYPHRAGQPVDTSKFSKTLFPNPYVIGYLGEPLKIAGPYRDFLANQAFYVQDWYGQLEVIGGARAFLEMSLMVLGSPYLMKILEVQEGKDLRVMTEDVFNRLIDFFNELAESEEIRQAVARAA
ncbi:MAG: hypothetical protein NC930_03065, partial [Candidatus Omnitrophica bacterium]|nr:hypothetical protein [Candidatus Omnitrophota bacterium]